jgi:predicted ATP-dependent endonuclease of OLD family
MQIKQFIIKNFRSIQEINLYDLQDLVILIGENSSGKTNILEALNICFNGFEHVPIQNLKPLTGDDYYFWFDQNTDKSIEFEATLSLGNTQLKKLSDNLKNADIKQQKGDLTIKRSIISVDNGIKYCNDEIDWGDIVIKRADDKYICESEPKLDLNGFVQTVTQEILKKVFNYIPLSRGPELTTPHGLVLNKEVVMELKTKGQDVTPKGMKEWNKVRQLYAEKGWTPGRLEYTGNRLHVPRGEINVPYEFEGAGYQELFNLLRQIEKFGDIVAVEEPENHLHPKLQKIFVKELLYMLSSSRGQVFLSTHSPFILNLTNPNTIWFVYKEGLESKASNISSNQDINEVLGQLGVKPSDLLFTNGILIVEGPSDKIVYNSWLQKIDNSVGHNTLLVIDAEGAGNIKKYLSSDAVQKTCIKIFALCDQDADKSLRKSIKGIVNDENIYTLEKGDIEDYYPRGLILEFLEEELPKREKEKPDIPKEISAGETVKKINELLGKDTWKIKLAKKIVKQMESKDIIKEIRDKLNKIISATE